MGDLNMDQNVGKCSNCGKRGPRFKFHNEYVDPVVKMDLCPECMATAFKCMTIFFATPAGKEAIARRQAQLTGT